MSRIVWLSDVHLNFVAAHHREAFYAAVRGQRPDAVLLTGDIAESRDVVDYLREMADHLAAPLWFVLGNHDFYHGSIAEVRARVEACCRDDDRLNYLTVARQAATLAPEVGLLGHDGWADGRLGDFAGSLVSMMDHRLIAELSGLRKGERWETLKRLADEAALAIRRRLPEALARFREVYFLTHVPPFREACWHEGAISDDQWLPHFTSHAVGQALRDVMRDHPQRRLTVLCGHTHGAGACRPAANLVVLTGGAVYGEPAIVGAWDVRAGAEPAGLVDPASGDR